MSIPIYHSRSSRREALFLSGLILAVLATRIPFLMHGLDEWDTANFVLSIVQFSIFGDQPHAPGQYFYVRLLQGINALTGGNELFTLSFASAVGSSLALVPYYLALRQVFQARVAMGAAVLTAFTLGYWVTSLRMISDPVATLFLYGTVCALLAGLRDRRWFVFGMVLCGVTLGVKQTAVYFLAPFAIAVNLVVLFRHGWRRPLVGTVGFAAAVAGWLLPSVHNCQGWANYVAACRAKQQENYAIESIIFHLTPGAARVQWQHNGLDPWGAPSLGPVMLCLAAVGWFLCLRRGARGLLFALFSVTVVFYAFFFLYRFNKYFVYYVPIYCALAAAAIFAVGDALARAANRPRLRLLLPGLAVAVLTAINFSLTAPLLPKINHFRAPPQAALEALLKMPGVEPTPLLLTDDITTGRELLYFVWKKKVDLLNRHPDLQDAVSALNAGRKVYFLSPLAFDAPPDGPGAARLLGTYVWKPELYEPLQGRADLRELKLYELRAPLPVDYSFQNAKSRPPLLLAGAWEDGWCGLASRFVLPCDESGPDFAHLRINVPETLGYRYPYQMVCRFADGSHRELTVAHPGQADFAVPLPDHPGLHTVELELLAPQVYRPSQHPGGGNDSRDLSVMLKELDCVTESRPLLTHRDGGWHEQETDGQNPWRWTTGDAVLSVLNARAGTLAVDTAINSIVDGNAVEVLVDGQPAAVSPLPGTAVEAFHWRLPVTAGFHLVTLHSRLPGRQPPNDGRTLALCVRGLDMRLEP